MYTNLGNDDISSFKIRKIFSFSDSVYLLSKVLA